MIALIFAWSSGFILFAFEAVTLKPEKSSRETDAIIVLTGGPNRISEGLELLAEGKSGYLFVTGVNNGVSSGYIPDMYKGKTELPDCCIEIDYQADNTMNNAFESKKWIDGKKIQSIRLVTSDYHMARAMLEFRHALPETEIIRNPVTEYPGRNRHLLKSLLIEYNKTLVTWLRHRLEDIGFINGHA